MKAKRVSLVKCWSCLILMLLCLQGCEMGSDTELRKVTNEELLNYFRYSSWPKFRDTKFYDEEGLPIPEERGFKLLECMNCLYEYYADENNEIVKVTINRKKDDSHNLYMRNQAFLEGPDIEPIQISCENLNDQLQSLYQLDQGNRNMDTYDLMLDMENMAKVSYAIDHCPHETFTVSDLTIMYTIIQHAPYRYRKKYESFLMKSVREGLLSKSSLAYYLDRNYLDEGKEQLFGTQYRYNKKGETYIYDLHCPAEVNLRRSWYGLSPIDESDVMNFE